MGGKPERLLFIEPFLAWRAWVLDTVAGLPRLKSVVYNHVWEPGRQLDARCMKVPPVTHGAPDQDCRCGVYGSTDITHLRHYVQETKKNHPHGPPVVVTSTNRVFGLVKLWGTVIECSQGYRAQCAYPHSLYLPCAMHHHAGGLEAYGVPVTCVDEAHAFEALRRVVEQVRRGEKAAGDDDTPSV